MQLAEEKAQGWVSLVLFPKHDVVFMTQYHIDNHPVYLPHTLHYCCFWYSEVFTPRFPINSTVWFAPTWSHGAHWQVSSTGYWGPGLAANWGTQKTDSLGAPQALHVKFALYFSKNMGALWFGLVRFALWGFSLGGGGVAFLSATSPIALLQQKSPTCCITYSTIFMSFHSSLF